MSHPVESKARSSGLVWAIVLTGLALPWVCGAGVKIYLDFNGMPTWPWSAFLSPFQLAFLLPATVWISLPLFVLAYAAMKLLPVDFLGLITPHARSAFLIGGLLGDAPGASCLKVPVRLAGSRPSCRNGATGPEFKTV